VRLTSTRHKRFSRSICAINARGVQIKREGRNSLQYLSLAYWLILVIFLGQAERSELSEPIGQRENGGRKFGYEVYPLTVKLYDMLTS
jgi:hypothetical protein